MRFTDRKGIKIYCCVSFSPCKVWIKCHTLACELLNELVCSPRCGPCKYPSWVWNGDCLVVGGGSQELGSVGHIWVWHRQLGRSEGLEYQTPLLTGCVWLVFHTWSGRWWQMGKLPDGYGFWWFEGRRWLTGNPKMRWLTCTVKMNLLVGKFRCERKEVCVHK